MHKNSYTHTHTQTNGDKASHTEHLSVIPLVVSSENTESQSWASKLPICLSVCPSVCVVLQQLFSGPQSYTGRSGSLTLCDATTATRRQTVVTCWETLSCRGSLHCPLLQRWGEDKGRQTVHESVVCIISLLMHMCMCAFV